MAPRVLIGYHPNYNQYGVWMTKPGFDVTIVQSQDNFLLKPDYKVEQIIASGRIYVDPGGIVGSPFVEQTVPLPTTFATKRPYAALCCSQGGGVDQYPHDLNWGGVVGAGENVLYASFRSGSLVVGISTGNLSYVIYISYMIFFRSIGN